MSDAQPHDCLSQTVGTKNDQSAFTIPLQGQKRNSTQLRSIGTIDSHKQAAFQYHSRTSAKKQDSSEWWGWPCQESKPWWPLENGTGWKMDGN